MAKKIVRKISDSIAKYIFPLTTVILILLFYLACSGAALSIYVAFGCEQDEFGTLLIQLAMLFTGLSWPIVIVGVITISRRFYLNVERQIIFKGNRLLKKLLPQFMRENIMTFDLAIKN